MQQIATTSSDIFVELSNSIKAWNIACVLDWLRIKQHQSIKASNNIKAGCESNRAEVSRQKFEQSMDWLTIAVLTGSENPCFLLLWVALNKSIADSSSPLRSSFWNVFQQKSKCYQQESEMLFNEDQTVRSPEKSSHSGKNVCCVVPGTSSLIVHDFFSIHLVRHIGFVQKSILSAWSCVEHKASNKVETNLMSWGRPHLHQSLPFTIRQIRHRRFNADFICGYGIKILLLDLMASVLWIFLQNIFACGLDGLRVRVHLKICLPRQQTR